MPHARRLLTHVDAAGRARMVDVSDKSITERRARAEAVVRMSAAADSALSAGRLPKGAALDVVRLAAIGGAKQTSSLIPLCHPLRLTSVDAQLERAGARRWRVVTEVAAFDRTGVEMEALTAASIGALALYDMVKAVDRGAEVERIALLAKSGGRSGTWTRGSRDGAGRK
jgi:cyclic pyranopterin phosphate synthase